MRGKIQLKHGEDYYIKVLLKETKLKEVMTTPVVSIDIDASFTEVPKKFKKFGIRHLPVVSQENRLVGVISQSGLFRIQPPKKTLDGDYCYDDEMLSGVILKHVMRKDPFFMHEDDNLGDAIVKIVEQKYGCIPVLDVDNKVSGVVTQIDMLKIAAQIYLENI